VFIWDLVIKRNEESQKVYDEVNDINKLSEKIVNANEGYKSPIDYINLINDLKPDGIGINQIHVDMEAGTIGVRGLADTRTSLIDWKGKLEGASEFASVLLPPSSYIEDTNIDYELGVNFKAAAVKSAPKLKL
jgi:hypothetical protein